MTDGADDPDVGVGENKIGSDRVRPFAEEPHGVVPVQVGGRRLTRGERERLDGENVLAANAKRLTARHEDLEPVACAQERDEDGSAGKHLLEIVEDEEEVP